MWAAEKAEGRGCAVEVVGGLCWDFGMPVGAVPVDVVIGMLPEELRAAQQEVLDEAVTGISTTTGMRAAAAKRTPITPAPVLTTLDHNAEKGLSWP